MKEDLEIDVSELRLDGFFSCTACPVQAEGTIAEFPFYFRARHDKWTFAIALDSDGDAVGIESSEQGFFRKASYGHGPHDAGYMPLDEARQIIARCVEEFWRENSSQG